jgi:hypothetical protein
MAQVVAAALPSALETVERRQYGTLDIPVRVHVCATLDTFAKYTTDPLAGGHTINDRVFISPKPQNTVERVPHVLTHELSHLQLGQKLGLLSGRRLPVWFSEGLATFVSDGSGAEGVTEDQARRAISEGHTFAPEAEGSLLHNRGAATYGLDEHLFYRQAGMFVSYLRSLDERSFQAFLRGVEDGAGVGPSFAGAYGTSLEVAWHGFVNEAKAHTAIRPVDAGPRQ